MLRLTPKSRTKNQTYFAQRPGKAGVKPHQRKFSVRLSRPYSQFALHVEMRQNRRGFRSAVSVPNSGSLGCRTIAIGRSGRSIFTLRRTQTVSLTPRLAGKARLSGSFFPERLLSPAPIRSSSTRRETRAFPALGTFAGRTTFTSRGRTSRF